MSFIKEKMELPTRSAMNNVANSAPHEGCERGYVSGSLHLDNFVKKYSSEFYSDTF